MPRSGLADPSSDVSGIHAGVVGPGVQVPARHPQLHAAEAHQPADPGLVEGVSQRDLAELDEAPVLDELRGGAIEDAAAAGIPGFAQRYRHTRSRSGDGLVAEVAVTEDEVPSIAVDLGFLRGAEVMQGALGAVVGVAALPHVEQSANRELVNPERGPERAGPVGLRIADHVSSGHVVLGISVGGHVEGSQPEPPGTHRPCCRGPPR